MTAQIMTAASVGFGIYGKYGVSKVNARITSVAGKETIKLFITKKVVSKLLIILCMVGKIMKKIMIPGNIGYLGKCTVIEDEWVCRYITPNRTCIFKLHEESKFIVLSIS